MSLKKVKIQATPTQPYHANLSPADSGQVDRPGFRSPTPAENCRVSSGDGKYQEHPGSKAMHPRIGLHADQPQPSFQYNTTTNPPHHSSVHPVTNLQTLSLKRKEKR